MVIEAKNVEDFFIEYFGEQIKKDGLNTNISDLGMDSLALVEFLMNFEEKFGTELNVDKLEKDTTLSDLVSMLLE